MFLKTNRINVKTQANSLRFHLEKPASDYPILRLDEMPRVEVFIVPSDKNASGIGEMGVPPVALPSQMPSTQPPANGSGIFPFVPKI